MRPETDLVPYSCGRLDGSPLLVLAPHPDDEVFGCGGVLAQAGRGGGSVRVVVLTDGSAQGEADTRRAESCEAARRLGVPEPEFWGLADRTLDPDDPALAERLRTLLVDYRPSVVLVPSPAEVHPDHRALALLVYRVLQGATPGTELHAAVQAVRLAAYEVSAVLRPNLLVDVTAEWEDVLAAAKAFASQVGRLPYVEVLDGIASARRLTLPPSVRRAEAYFVTDLRSVRTHAASEWAASQGPSAGLEPAELPAPIDVVVRTRSRPQLLAQALDSLVAQQQPPASVVVVNDGGESVEEICSRAGERLALDLVELERPRGRAGAAQLGLERCTAGHVVFLDDDDLFLPEHLAVLGRAVARGATVPYTDAVQGVWELDSDGAPRPLARHRTFGGDFDPARLRLVNHIPLPTVALPRELALEVGGFPEGVELYEDWDLLLRLAERTPFVHLPVVTCEYRVFSGSTAITSANPPGSVGQLEALAELWQRRGLADHPGDLAAGVMGLVAERDRQAEQVRLLDEQLVEARGANQGLEANVRALRDEVGRLTGEIEEISRQAEESRVAAEAALDEARASAETAEQQAAAADSQREAAAEEARAMRAEIERLNALLDTIYGSRTWKVHQALERLRGRRRE